MIDFVKLRVKDREVIQKLRDNSLLSFKQSTTRLGIDNGIIAEFHGMTFSIYHANTAEIRGSLHKFWNSYVQHSNQHNWNDFTQTDLLFSIEILCALFELDSTKVSIHNIEFGVNIELPSGRTAVEILQRFSTYGTKKFEMKPVSGPGYYVEAALTDYYVKAYDKGTQYGKSEPMIRFENKTVAMKKVPGITVLSDLTDSKKLEYLGSSLLRTFDSCLIDEPIELSKLTADEQEVIQYIRAVRDDTNWKTGQWKTITDKQRSRLRQRHQKIVSKYGATIRPMVRTLIADKWQRLSFRRPILEDSQVLPGQVRKMNNPAEDFESVIVVKPDHTNDLSSFLTPNALNTEEKEGRRSREKFRFCLVTSTDISKQPSDTKFVTKSTLLDLYDRNPDEFNRLATEFLPAGRRAGNDVARWAYLIAHNIRNRSHNPAHNLRRRVMRAKNSRQLPLFPGHEMHLDSHSQALLDRFKGTPYEVVL